MKSYDTRAVAQDLATLTIEPGMSETDTDTEPPVKMLTSFNQCSIGIMRFSGQTPWERHPDGDELLQVLEGCVEMTVLAEAGRSGRPSRRARSLWCRGACGTARSRRPTRLCSSPRR
jgi:hypothetical protein